MLFVRGDQWLGSGFKRNDSAEFDGVRVQLETCNGYLFKYFMNHNGKYLKSLNN